MNEAIWLSSEDPAVMLSHVQGKVSDRKMRLYAIAYCHAVSAELGADAEQCVEWNSLQARDATNWARGWAGDQKHPPPAWRAALLRSLVGNPWRTVEKYAWNQNITRGDSRKIWFNTEWLRWNGGTVPALAQAMYDTRDFGSMPVLHDALVESGVTDDQILTHCLSGGPHVRGDWLTDLILGKE